MNLMDARLDGRGTARIENWGELSLPHGLAQTEGRSVLLGIRPDALALGTDGLAARIESIEPTGSETILTCSSGAGTVVVATRQRQPLEPGQAVNLSIEAPGVHLLIPTPVWRSAMSDPRGGTVTDSERERLGNRAAVLEAVRYALGGENRHSRHS